MHRLEVIGWIGTIAAVCICGVAARMWYLALEDLRFTKDQIRRGNLGAGDPARVVARWNFTTASVHLFFAVMLIWILVPEIPPTPRDSATTMAIGIPLIWLLGISCQLLTDMRFRRQLRESVRRASAGNVVPLDARRPSRKPPRMSAVAHRRTVDRGAPRGSVPKVP